MLFDKEEFQERFAAARTAKERFDIFEAAIKTTEENVYGRAREALQKALDSTDDPGLQQKLIAQQKSMEDELYMLRASAEIMKMIGFNDGPKER
jgi:hypothetical protein